MTTWLKGLQIHPRHAWELHEELTGYMRVCFVGFAEVDTMTKFHEIRGFGGEADDWLRDYSNERVLQEIEQLKALSVRLRDTCQQYGLKHM